MTKNELTMLLQPEANETKVLMMRGSDEVMKALLPPSSQAHYRAAATLAEAAALWYQRQVSVVLYADVRGEPFASVLCDGLGFGGNHLHYEVDVVEPGNRQSGRQLYFPRQFSELKSLCERRRG